jgi:hypothetical protein
MRACIASAFVVLGLAACASKSDVVSVGAGTYRVRTDAGNATNDIEVRAYGIRRANEYCDEKGLHAVITVGPSQDWHLFSIQHPEVRFYCDDKLPGKPTPKTATS